MKKVIFFTILSIALFITSPAKGSSIQAKIGFMLTDFESSLQYDKGNIPGTKVNLGSDMDLQNNEAVPFVELWLGGRFKLNLGYMDSRYEGDARKFSKITIGGETIHDGLGGIQDVKVTIDFRTFDLAAQFNLFDNEKFRFGAIAGGKYIYYQNRFKNSATSVTSNNEEETIFPYIGGMVEITPIKYVTFSLRLRGGRFEWSAVNIKRGEYLDFELGVAFNFNESIGVMVEYRFFQVKLTRKDTSEANSFVTEVDAVVFSLILRT